MINQLFFINGSCGQFEDMNKENVNSSVHVSSEKETKVSQPPHLFMFQRHT